MAMNPARPEPLAASAINADLHCHSIFSDGTLSPEALAERAKAQGVQLWSLTDHDEISGQARAAAAAAKLDLAYVTGVEISVTFLDETVHMLGLGFDAENRALQQGLADTRNGRDARAREMSAQLEKIGIPQVYEGALKYVGNPNLISRSHFARYLVEIGVCREVSDVFRKYLTPGKPGYVEHRWAKLSDAIAWVQGAGGVAVIAHPGRYKFSPNEEFALFSEFTRLGGRGVEVVTGNHSTAQVKKYADLADEFQLCASRGSDFHSPSESHTELGSLPPLPSHLTPVWQELQTTP